MCKCLILSPAERQVSGSTTGGSGGVGVATSASMVAGAISRELAELRPLAQFPEEIACILTQQEQELYQRVRAPGPPSVYTAHKDSHYTKYSNTFLEPKTSIYLTNYLFHCSLVKMFKQMRFGVDTDTHVLFFIIYIYSLSLRQGFPGGINVYIILECCVFIRC